MTTATKTLTLPTIHDNGTSAVRLGDAYSAAYAALDAAVELMRETAPNGRDYYPQGPDAYEAATAEHRNRIGAIRKAMDELEALAIHCGS